MKTDLNLQSLRAKADKTIKLVSGHLIFIAVLAVLMAYLVVVWQISGLATAEPSPEEEAAAISAQNRIPKIDKDLVEKIENLEAHNPEIRSLFNKARNNPFQE